MRPRSRNRRSLRLIAPERRRDSWTDCSGARVQQLLQIFVAKAIDYELSPTDSFQHRSVSYSALPRNDGSSPRPTVCSGQFSPESGVTGTRHWLSSNPRLAEIIGSGRWRPYSIHHEIFQRFPMHYYRTTYQSEWVTDIVFRAAEDLRRLYPLLVHHAITTFRSLDVLCFLGKQFTEAGHINGHVKAAVTSDLKQ